MLKRAAKALEQPSSNRFIRPLQLALRVGGLVAESLVSHWRTKRLYSVEILLYDRYYYDSLVILAYRHPKVAEIILSVAKVIPRPSVVAILDVDQATCIKRKPEHTLEEATKLCMLYRRLSMRLAIPLIDGNQPIDVVGDEVWRLANAQFGKQS